MAVILVFVRLERPKLHLLSFATMYIIIIFKHRAELKRRMEIKIYRSTGAIENDKQHSSTQILYYTT